MIEEIYIQDLGVIAETRLNFGSGLTVLSGETGAGKTMILSALSLLLGGRSDSTAIRQGQSQSFVEGRWWLKSPQAINARLDDAGISQTDGELIVNRAVSAEGRSRASISARSVPVSLLAELGDQLVVVHGQSDQIRLRSLSAQREALDQFAGAEHLSLLADYSQKFNTWRSLSADLARLKQGLESRETRIAELRDELLELEQLNPQPNEDLELAERAARLGNLEDLRIASAIAHNLLSSDDFDSEDAISKVGKARKTLEAAAAHDGELGRFAEELQQVGAAMNDIAAELSRYLTKLEGDGEESLELVQQRRAAINAAIRKYGPTLDDVISYRETAAVEMSGLEFSDEEVENLEIEVSTLHAEITRVGEALSSSRASAAKELEELVSKELHSLAMPGASLKVAVERTAEPSSTGFDSIQILLSAYPGAEPRPLGKGASGGELSRIMLAIEVVLARNEQAPTFIFDEVDAGVGGSAAIEIGRRLARLAQQAQVIVVTHLAQVAAFADHHLRVSNSDDGGFTNSSVASLTEFDRISELARMLSGLSESEAALQHATELLDLARAEFGPK